MFLQDTYYIDAQFSTRTVSKVVSVNAVRDLKYQQLKSRQSEKLIHLSMISCERKYCFVELHDFKYKYFAL